jgi:hypothetical protein
MFFSKKLAIAVVALALSAIMSASSQAAFFTIQDYINGTTPTGHTLTVDDKVFDFSATVFNSTAGGPSASQVTVIPDGVGTNAPGVEFQSGGWNINGMQTIDTTFNFTVTSLGPKIVDAEMNLISAGARNGGLIAITETTKSGSTFEGNLLVNSLTLANGSDHVFLADAVQTLTVQKDISLSGTQENSFASLSTFDQRFSEETPEPSSVVLLGLGVLGMVGYRWRRQGK